MTRRMSLVLLAIAVAASGTMTVYRIASRDSADAPTYVPRPGYVELQHQRPGPAGDPLKDWVEVFEGIYKVCDGPNLLYSRGDNIAVLANSAECVGWNR